MTVRIILMKHHNRRETNLHCLGKLLAQDKQDSTTQYLLQVVILGASHEHVFDGAYNLMALVVGCIQTL